MTLELASPFFPSAFLLLMSAGSVLRSMTGVAGGATRAALTQHFALRRNAADIAAKEQSQEILTTMAGMALGLGFTKAAADSPAAAWLLFCVLTWVHVHANVVAMRCLVLRSLNGPRMEVLLAGLQEGVGGTAVLCIPVCVL
jgi:hypothetical protein